MPRWLIVVLGVGVVAGIGVLVWKLQAEPDRPTRAAKPAPEASEAPRAPRGTPGQVTPPPAVEPDGVGDEVAPRKTVDEVGPQYLEKLLSRTVPNQVMRAIAGCYAGEAGDPEQRMTFDFTVTFDEDVASLSDVTLAESIGQAQLEECAVDVLGALTWRQPRAPNFSRKESVDVAIGDLVKRHKQFVRQDEDND